MMGAASEDIAARDRSGAFAGEDPLEILRRWLAEAERSEPNDANAMALATVDADGLPNARVVLLKEIAPDGLVFYTNHGSDKGRELAARPLAAAVLHWKSLRRQVRVRGPVTREDGPRADAYYASRGLGSRIGAWASRQSRPLGSRAELERGGGGGAGAPWGCAAPPAVLGRLPDHALDHGILGRRRKSAARSFPLDAGPCGGGLGHIQAQSLMNRYRRNHAYRCVMSSGIGPFCVTGLDRFRQRSNNRGSG